MSLVERRLKSYYTPQLRFVGVRIEDYDGERPVMSAPMEHDVSHMGSAFISDVVWLILGAETCL